MKILQVGIASEGGGAETVARTLHEEFLRKDLDCHWIVAQQSSKTFRNFTPLALQATGYMRFYLGIKKLRKELKKLDPDIVLVHCELPEFLLTCASFRMNFKIIVVEHQPFHWTGINGFVIRTVRTILNLRNAYWIHLRKSRKPANSDTHFYIPNPIQLQDTKMKKSRREVFHSLRFLFVGRMTFDKGFDTLLEMLSRSSIKKLETFGDGPLRQLLSKHSIPIVENHGFVENFWNGVDSHCVVLVTSRWEGDGLVILEALVREIPLLIMKFDGIEELPLPSESICSSPEEFISKLDALNHMKDNALLERLISQSAARLIIEERNPSRIANRYIEIFRKVNGSAK